MSVQLIKEATPELFSRLQLASGSEPWNSTTRAACATTSFGVPRQHLAHPMAVMSVAEQRHDFDLQAFQRSNLLQLALDVVERQLRHLEQHQAVGTQSYDLAAELRAD